MNTQALEFAAKFHAMSPWAGVVDLDGSAVLSALQAMCANPDAFVEITDLGAIGGVIVPLWFNEGAKIAVELFWYSEHEGEGKRLREAFETWAKSKDAHFSQLSCLANHKEPAVRRLMGMAGYDAKEVSLIKAL